MKWEDKSSYSRGGKRSSEVYTAKLGKLRLSVVKGHIYFPNSWVVQCKPFYTDHELKAKSADEAKAEAEKLFRQKIAEVMSALELTE